MREADQQDVACTHIHVSKFQAAPLVEEERLLSVSTARKSSIEAKGMCAACGERVTREDLQSCLFCGSLLCPDCNKQALKKARRAGLRY